nr:MAG: hypothetical protein J07AB56_01550 [Candidatus Nanosalinarum sp. J07AB56]
MEFVEHLGVSTVPAGLCAAAYPEQALPVAASALVAGTLIDLDHIPLSRLRHGDWSMLRTLVTGLPTSLWNHGAVAKGGFDAHWRLMSHTAVAVLILTPNVFVRGSLPAAAGLSLPIHLLADLYADHLR